MNKINLCFVVFLLTFGVASAATTSFDCSKAKDPADLAICANEELAALDVKNAELFSAAKVNSKQEATAIARSSYKAKVGCGADVRCIKNVYTESILSYQALSGNAQIPSTEEEIDPTEETPPVKEETTKAVAPAAAPAAAVEPSNTSEEESSNSTGNVSYGAIFALIGFIASVGFLIFANSKRGTYQLEKRDAIKRYFAKFPAYAIVLILVGAGLLATDETSTRVGGLLSLLIGTFIIFNWIKQPTDQQMDEYIAEDILTVTNKSLSKSDVDKSQLVSDLLTLTGFRIENAAGAEYNWKKGKDGIARFTPINFTSIIMTEHQLVTYNAALDLMTGNSLNETTDEYFYKDVVSVSTETSSATFVDPKNKNSIQQLNTAEFFKLTTSGGTNIKVFIKDPKLIEMMGNSALPGTDAEKAVQSIRKMLREKKV